MNNTKSYDTIEFVQLEKGRVMLGNDQGSILHTAEQPRHEVLICHEVWVSKNCITKGQWNAHVPRELRYPTSDEMWGMADTRDYSQIMRFLENLNKKAGVEMPHRLVSEAEWELLASRMHDLDISDMPEYNGEILADQPHVSYWGAPCDGGPWLENSENRSGAHMQVTRRRNPLFSTWILRGAIHHSTKQPGLGFRVARVHHTDTSDNIIRLPSEANRAQILRRELLFFLLIGVLPSMLWAGYNAPGYIARGWANLIFGGLMISLFSAILWRPRRPTWVIKEDRMVPIPRNRIIHP